MSYIPDAYDHWRSHEARQQEALERCPRCVHCHRYIQDERLWVINDETWHEECAENEFRKWTEDYEN